MPAAETLQLLPPQRQPRPTLVLRGQPRLRQAVCVALRDARGTVGWGEAVPLPGYSRDDAAQAQQVLQALAQQGGCPGVCGLPGRLLLADAAPGAPQLQATLAPWAAALQASPSARFALECALLDLLARRAGRSAAAWLAQGRPLQPVPVSLLLPDDDHQAPAAAVAAAAGGWRVLKLKIARADRSAAAELALLQTLRRAVEAAAPGPVRLRLDANGALPAQGLLARLQALAGLGVELVEEPQPGAALLHMPALPLPWAADESLHDEALTEALLALPPPRAPAALVLKPAELGLLRCLALAQRARAAGLALIVTHSLDGDGGLAAAQALALALAATPGADLWACGLAPHPGLLRSWPWSPWLTPPSQPGLGLSEAAAPGVPAA